MVKRGLFFLLFSLLLTTFVQAQDEPLRVVTTTTIIADVAQNVGGDLVNVTALIPLDADVHAFEATPSDIVQVTDAAVVLVNGAGLESFLGDLIENAGSVQPVIVSNGIEMLAFAEHDAADADHAHEGTEHIGVLGDDADCNDEHAEDEESDHEEDHDHGDCDPHVWTDPNNVKTWATNIADAFAAADPANAEVYAANAAAYIEQLTALDTEVQAMLADIPEDQRILVTNHEFLGYFAHAYEFEVVGVVLPGGSTLAEPNPQELAALVEVIRAEGVPAIFTEISASSQLADVVAEETGIDVVMGLYSDSLSESAATYLDYVRANAQTIAEALR